MTPDKPKQVYKSQLHDRWKRKLRIQDLPEQVTPPADDGKIQPRKRDLKLAKKENNKLRSVSEIQDESEPKQRTFAPKIVQRRLQLNIPGTGSGLGLPKRNNALKLKVGQKPTTQFKEFSLSHQKPRKGKRLLDKLVPQGSNLAPLRSQVTNLKRRDPAIRPVGRVNERFGDISPVA